MEGNLFDSHDDGFTIKQKPNLITTKDHQSNENGCFDCNICLDTSHDPIVTLCGHLFCWPCIYKWLSSNNNNSCPVCKSNITISSLVPLYGRGMSTSAKSTETPNRPSPPSLRHQTMSPNRPRGFTATESTDLANAVLMSVLYPVIGMFGDMVYTRISGTFTNAIAQQSPYQNQRMMQHEKSLNRVSIFFLCCIFLCLVLF